jgi:hypothetical protein
MVAGVMQIAIRALMHILESDPEVGGCPGNGLLLYCFTREHATNRVITSALICNKSQGCGEGTRLDYCDMTSAIGELGETIIMLGRFYSMLSCRLALSKVMPVHHGRRAAVRSQTV